METRDALVVAATSLLDLGGVEAVTLREVGRLAGVSHNAPYKHFTDKQALLAAVAARELAELRAAMRATAAEVPSPGELLKARMLGYVDWSLLHPERFKLVFGAWPTGSAELSEQATASWTTLVETVAAAQKSGELPATGDPERLAALIRSTTHGAISLALTGHLAADGKGHADAADLVHDLFAYVAPRSQ